jgi:hypothetical protein
MSAPSHSYKGGKKKQGSVLNFQRRQNLRNPLWIH